MSISTLLEQQLVALETCLELSLLCPLTHILKVSQSTRIALTNYGGFLPDWIGNPDLPADILLSSLDRLQLDGDVGLEIYEHEGTFLRFPAGAVFVDVGRVGGDVAIGSCATEDIIQVANSADATLHESCIRTACTLISQERWSSKSWTYWAWGAD